MRLTQDIQRAIQSCVEVAGSKSAFARRANIHVKSVRRYLSKTTQNIADDSWDKIYPLIKPYLPSNISTALDSAAMKDIPDSADLRSDEKILLDAYSELTEEMQETKLLEIIELAKEEIKKKSS